MNVLLWPSLYNWLTKALPGVSAILRDQDGAIPHRPFCTAKVISERRLGEPHYGELRDDGTVLIQQGADFTVSVNIYGDGAYAYMHDLVNACQKITMREFLRANGMAFIRTLNGPTSIDLVVGTGFEGRAQADFQMRANVEIVDDVGIIERVELTGTVHDYEHTEIIGVN